MREHTTDIMIIGAGPVGLMCAHLAQLSGLRTIIVDRSDGPLQVGRADALNARTLQLLEIAGLFDDLYPLGKTCNTSSVWADGKFVSRQSSWWDQLDGCLHKHFLMLGQSFLEQCLDKKLRPMGGVRRSIEVKNVLLTPEDCVTVLANGDQVRSRFVIGADGSRSFVRSLFNIPFEIVRPEIVWAVIDGVIQTDFPKVPEIIVCQTDSSDVAWIPREGDVDRFYVRMDRNDFSLPDAIAKINRALSPHKITFTKIIWFSRFSVKESVAEEFSVDDRVFLVGDACHIHSVNGGQGLNTGIGDAFNLIWKLKIAMRAATNRGLLPTYQTERKPVALSVVKTSGELVRATKESARGSHASDYVEIIQKRSGNITGMGIRYGEVGLTGSRLFDFEVYDGPTKTRMYSLLSYGAYSLLTFGNTAPALRLPDFIHHIHISCNEMGSRLWTNCSPYKDKALLVRPDSYIASAALLADAEAFVRRETSQLFPNLVDGDDFISNLSLS